MPVIDNQPLTTHERTSLDYYDALVRERYATAKAGSWIESKIPKSTATAKVAFKLKELAEIRGHTVGVLDDPDYWRFIFPPSFAVKTLPSISTITPIKTSVIAHTGPRVLIRMPTRDRPSQALSVLHEYRRLAGYPVTIEVVVDEDDKSMATSDVLQRLCVLDCIVTFGQHRSKVEAVNGGRVKDWDILVLASDDMWPTVDGYAKEIVAAMLEHFPYFDGLLYFDDGEAGKRCCTLPIFGWRLYRQFGFVYEPKYKSLCCDEEQTEVCRRMNRIAYVDKMVIEHRHPVTGKAPTDTLYKRNNDLHVGDKKLLENRRLTKLSHAQFGFEMPPVALSVCIATVPKRKQQLDRLVSYLYDQIIRDAPREVEIVIDSGEGHIGAKRQRMIEKAIGHYVAHVDDDDWVVHNYVKRIVDAIKKANYSVDCLSLWGRMTTNGGNVEPFHHSLVHKEWSKDSHGVYLRHPNHLNAVRRDLALKAGFPSDSSYGEDHDFSKKLLPLLHSEGSTGDEPLYHYWVRTDGGK